MEQLQAKIYTSGDELPPGLMEDDFFHSARFFVICQQTPRHRPYLVTLQDALGHIMSQMLAVVRYRSSWLPPYLYMHCRIMGEGVYAPDADRPGCFGTMLQAITSRLGPRMLYMEVSHLSQKMFGYSCLRDQRYFPVRWMSIHNSLHSRSPEERIGPKLQRRIDNAYERGIVTNEVQNEADFQEFYKLLRHHNWLKPKRYIPAEKFFSLIQEHPENGRLFLTRYREHVVGCSCVVYSHGQSYLWFAAYRRKSFVWLHPRELTIWHAIKDSYERGCEHIFFMDVGLPFRKNAFREFILRFGGKPVSTYRWFRCSIKWVNSLLTWVYRD